MSEATAAGGAVLVGGRHGFGADEVKRAESDFLNSYYISRKP